MAVVTYTNELAKREVKVGMYFDTAAVGSAAFDPATRLAGKSHIFYSADCGVPRSTDDTMEEKKGNTLAFDGMSEDERGAIERNVHYLFRDAMTRAHIEE